MNRLSVLGLLALGMALSAHAQPASTAPWSQGSSVPTAPRSLKPPPGDDGGTPTNVPFDGGLGALLVAGALYGKRAYSRKMATAKAAGGAL